MRVNFKKTFVLVGFSFMACLTAACVKSKPQVSSQKSIKILKDGEWYKLHANLEDQVVLSACRSETDKGCHGISAAVPTPEFARKVEELAHLVTRKVIERKKAATLQRSPESTQMTRNSLVRTLEAVKKERRALGGSRLNPKLFLPAEDKSKVADLDAEIARYEREIKELTSSSDRERNGSLDDANEGIIGDYVVDLGQGFLNEIIGGQGLPFQIATAEGSPALTESESESLANALLGYVPSRPSIVGYLVPTPEEVLEQYMKLVVQDLLDPLESKKQQAEVEEGKRRVEAARMKLLRSPGSIVMEKVFVTCVPEFQVKRQSWDRGISMWLSQAPLRVSVPSLVRKIEKPWARAHADLNGKTGDCDLFAEELASHSTSKLVESTIGGALGRNERKQGEQSFAGFKETFSFEQCVEKGDAALVAEAQWPFCKDVMEPK